MNEVRIILFSIKLQCFKQYLRWVMLTFAWFLAAGMKWSSEAIGSYSSYMHLISWILPAVKTIIIISTSSVDGDPFLGVCGVGNTNINNLHIFILAPLGKSLKFSFQCILVLIFNEILKYYSVVYLSAGCLFLIVGFVSLLRIRSTIKAQDETRQAKKLEKLIVKVKLYIGVQHLSGFFKNGFILDFRFLGALHDSSWCPHRMLFLRIWIPPQVGVLSQLFRLWFKIHSLLVLRNSYPYFYGTGCWYYVIHLDSRK